jgi:hypothetical protein
MPSNLASTLYAEFRSAQQDPTATPAYGNLDAEQRRVWDRVAAKAEEQIAASARFDATLAQERARLQKSGVMEHVDLATLTPTGAEFSCKDCGKTVEVEAVRCSTCSQVPLVPVPGDRLQRDGRVLTVATIAITFAEADLVIAPEKTPPAPAGHWPSMQPNDVHACKVCGATPDESGERVHGKGCYQLSEDGGGSDWPG